MVRDRIQQLLTYLVRQIYCSTGGVILGRVTGAGVAQEITVGSGLSFDGTTLTADAPAVIELSAVLPGAVLSFTLTGITSPAPVGSLVFIKASEDTGGRWFWENESGEPIGTFAYDGTKWTATLTKDAAAYTIESAPTSALTPYEADGPWTVTDGAGSPVFTVNYGATPTALGQSAIVEHSDNTFTEWVAVQISPPVWLPRTAGVIWNADASAWGLLTLTGATLDLTTLPDQ